ncbi:MAG: hypothetical protein AABZ32_11275 [Bacteroidota bacterium]
MGIISRFVVTVWVTTRAIVIAIPLWGEAPHIPYVRGFGRKRPRNDEPEQ